jgi:uncharacterized membrane protein
MATTGKSSQDLLQNLVDAHGAEADEASRWRNHVSREIGRGVQRLEALEAEVRRFRSTFVWVFVLSPFLVTVCYVLAGMLDRAVRGG